MIVVLIAAPPRVETMQDAFDVASQAATASPATSVQDAQSARPTG